MLGYEGVHECAGPAAVALELLHLGKLVVAYGRGHQVLVEFAVPELGHLGQDEVSDLFEALAVLGKSLDEELAVVGPVVVLGIDSEGSLFLVQVDVQQTGHSVVEDRAHDVGHLAVLELRAGISP